MCKNIEIYICYTCRYYGNLMKFQPVNCISTWTLLLPTWLASAPKRCAYCTATSPTPPVAAWMSTSHHKPCWRWGKWYNDRCISIVAIFFGEIPNFLNLGVDSLQKGFLFKVFCKKQFQPLLFWGVRFYHASWIKENLRESETENSENSRWKLAGPSHQLSSCTGDEKWLSSNSAWYKYQPHTSYLSLA